MFDANKKLGCWNSYLEMRETIIQANAELGTLSKDLGAFAGLLFDVGIGKLKEVEHTLGTGLSLAQDKMDAVRRKRHQQVEQDMQEERLHTKVQYQLAKLGRALGYDVSVARNDRGASCQGAPLAYHCIESLPDLGLPPEVHSTVDLIDVLWLHPGMPRIVCAFEVEKSHPSIRASCASPTWRYRCRAKKITYTWWHRASGKEIVDQLRRPMFQRHDEFTLSYIFFEELDLHFESLCKFGGDHSVLTKLACRCV